MADFQLRTGPATVVGIVAQGDRDRIRRCIVVDGVVKAERISHEENAFTVCPSSVA